MSHVSVSQSDFSFEMLDKKVTQIFQANEEAK